MLNPMIRKIIVADDQQLIRQGICSLLAQRADMKVVGEAGNGSSVVQLVRKLLPDVVIMDVNMPHFDSVETTRQILSESSKVKVIVLLRYFNRLLVADMFKMGVAGFLLKQCDFEELLEAIRTVLDNQIYVSPRIASMMVDSYNTKSSDSDGAKDLVLTEREYEIIKLLSEGKSTKVIALHVNMSVQTVDACRRQIMKKLNLDSLAQLVKYAIRQGLTPVKY